MRSPRMPVAAGSQREPASRSPAIPDAPVKHLGNHADAAADAPSVACPMTTGKAGHLIIEALLLAEPTREMDSDVGSNLDPLGQDPA